jgi:hypothetical protein
VLRLTARTDFTDVVVGDRKGRTVRRSAPLRTGDRADFRVADAAYVILQRKAPAAARLTAPLAASATVGRFISDATGIERGGSYTSPNQKSLRLSGSSTSQTFRFVSHGGDSEIAYDYFFTAPSPDSAVEVAFRNTQIQHGNGSTARVYVNGALAKSEHLGPVKQPDGRVTADTNARVFRVPVGAGAGRPIVVTVAVWGNGDDNADEIWVTEPKLVRDAATAPSVRTVAVVGD